MTEIEEKEQALPSSWKVGTFYQTAVYFRYHKLNKHFIKLFAQSSFLNLGTKRDAEDRLPPKNVDADDSDVDVKSEDER